MTNADHAFATVAAAQTDAELLEMFNNLELAVGWALEHLDPLEGHAFLKAWKDGDDLMPFIKAYRQDVDLAAAMTAH